MAGPSLMATLGANISGFIQDLETAKGQAKKHGEGIGSAFGEELTSKLARIGSAIAIEEYARRTLEWADSMGNLAIRTGLSVEQLQILENIGSKSGNSVEQLASFYERLGKAMATAHAGGAKGAETEGALKRLGISSETMASGDMGKAFAEVAEHLQKSGEITPQLEADIAKIFKNAREAIPALKSMTEDAQVWERTLTVSVEHMAAMKGASDHLKDAWHFISLAGKSFIGELSYGLETVIGNLSALPRWAATLFETGSLEKANTAAIGQLRKVAEDRAKLEKELGGQKPSKDAYAELEDKGAEKAAKKAEEQERTNDERRAKEADKAKSIREQIAEIGRKADMQNMTAAEKREAVEGRIAKLKREYWEMEAYGAPSELEKAEKEKEIAEREAELAGIKNDKAERQKLHDLQYDSLRASGFVIGGLSQAPELAMLDVQKKSEEHLAAIRKGITQLFLPSQAKSDDTVYN